MATARGRRTEHGLRGAAPRAVPRQPRRRPGRVARRSSRATPEALLATQPGLARLLEARPARNGHASARTQPRRERPRPPPRPRRADGSDDDELARRRRRRDGARQGVPHARPPRRAPRPARLRAARRPGARAGAADPEADAGAAGAHPARRCCASTSRARRSPTRCRACARSYCGTIAYEIEHISDHEERVWLRQAIESGRYRQPLVARRARAAARAAQPGRGDGALPAPRVPRAEAVLRSRAST